MKYFYLAIILVASAVALNAQPPVQPDQPKRTPEDIARKQTSMLVRELNLRDSLVIDSIYRINVRHTKRRMQGLTRAEEIQGMQDFMVELQAILTPAQYDRFMNSKADRPRHPHATFVPAKPDSAGRRPQMP